MVVANFFESVTKRVSSSSVYNGLRLELELELSTYSIISNIIMDPSSLIFLQVGAALSVLLPALTMAYRAHYTWTLDHFLLEYFVFVLASAAVTIGPDGAQELTRLCECLAPLAVVSFTLYWTKRNLSRLFYSLVSLILVIILVYALWDIWWLRILWCLAHAMTWYIHIKNRSKGFGLIVVFGMCLCITLLFSLDDPRISVYIVASLTLCAQVLACPRERALVQRTPIERALEGISNGAASADSITRPPSPSQSLSISDLDNEDDNEAAASL